MRSGENLTGYYCLKHGRWQDGNACLYCAFEKVGIEVQDDE